MYGEAASAIDPALLTRTPEELQECKSISRRPVTMVRSLAQWSGPPDEFAGAHQKIVDIAIGELGKAVHDTSCPVTMLNQEGCPPRTMLADGLRPGRAIVFPASCLTERFSQPRRPARLLGIGKQVPAPEHREGIASEAMDRADMRSLNRRLTRAIRGSAPAAPRAGALTLDTAKMARITVRMAGHDQLLDFPVRLTRPLPKLSKALLAVLAVRG
jgi:hypothetical protein